MKRVIFLMFFAFLLATSASSFAQRKSKAPVSDENHPAPLEETGTEKHPRMRNPMDEMRELFDKAKNEDGDIQIEKASDLFAENFKKGFVKADADGNGILDKEEIKSIQFFGHHGIDGPQGPERGPSHRGKPEDKSSEEKNPDILDDSETGPPPRGHFAPMRDPLADAKTEDGQIDLSKLPEKMPEEFRNIFTDADADADGLLNDDEQQSIPFLKKGPDGSDQGQDSRRRPKGLPPRKGYHREHSAPNSGPWAFFSAVEKAKTESGEINISQLEENVRKVEYDFLQTADADGNGLLTEDELKSLFSPPQRHGERSNHRPAKPQKNN